MVLDDYKHGSDLIFLPADREIRRLYLWVCRAITAFIFIATIGSLVGIIVAAVIYISTIRVLSSEAPRPEVKVTAEDVDVDTNHTSIEDGDEKQAIVAVFDKLDTEVATTQRELKCIFQYVGAGYADADEWWEQLVEPELESHPRVEKLDDIGLRWRLRETAD